MLNFDSVLDEQKTNRLVVQVKDTVPTVTDTVTIRQRPETRATQISKEASAWDWEDLRNYVVAQIETKFGKFPRNPLRESGIFKGFITRWGTQAGPIAMLAFDLHDGYWKGAPIQVTRFCARSDPYFAEQLAHML